MKIEIASRGTIYAFGFPRRLNVRYAAVIDIDKIIKGNKDGT